MSPTSKKALEQLIKDVQATRSKFSEPKSVRYTTDQKLSAIALAKQGVSAKLLCEAIGVSTERLRLWQQDIKLKNSTPPGFKRLSIAQNVESPKLKVSHQHEARIETKNGLSIFIPVSALTSTLLESLGGGR